MREVEARKLSVNETNDFFVIECKHGIYGLIPKDDSYGRKTKFSNPMEVCLYENGKNSYGLVHFRPSQFKKLQNDRVLYDENLIRRASFFKELRLYLYKQTPFRRVL